MTLLGENRLAFRELMIELEATAVDRSALLCRSCGNYPDWGWPGPVVTVAS
jgi:hypothetical protein